MFDIRGIYNFFSDSKFQQYLGDILLYFDFLDAGMCDSRDVPVVLLKNGSVMIVFKISGIDSETLLKEDLLELDRVCRGFFDIVKEKVTFSSYLLRRKVSIPQPPERKDAPKVVRYLEKSKREYWKAMAEETFTNDLYCAVSIHDEFRHSLDLRRLTHCHEDFTINVERTQEKVRRVLEVLDIAAGVFGQIGFTLLDKQAVFSFLFRVLNLRDAPGYRDDISLHAQLLRSEIEFLKTHALIGGDIYVSAIPVIDPPLQTDVNFWKALQSTKGEFLMVQHFCFLGTSDYEKRFLINRRIAGSLRLKSKSAERYCQEIDAFYEEIETERRRPIHYSLYLYNYSSSLEALSKQNKEIVNRLSRLGAYGKPEGSYLRHALFSSLPGHDIFNRKRRFFILSGNAGNMASIYNLSLGDEVPMEVFLDRDNGIYNFDPFSKRQDANHTAITGPTGSGKTFMVIQLLLSALNLCPYLFIIDPKKSYYPLFDVLLDIYPDKTLVLKYADDGVDFAFNPFLLQNPELGVSDYQFKFCENLLYLLIGKDIVDSQIRGLIGQGLETFFFEYAELLRKFPKPEPPLTLLHAIFLNMEGGARIALAIGNWLKGERGKILNSGSDYVSVSRFCYFDLRDLEERDDILQVVVFLILNKLKTVIEDESLLDVVKVLCLEESHIFLKKKEFQEVVDFFIRTGRTNNLKVILTSQSIDDYCDISESGMLRSWANAIINNLANIFLFGGQRNIEKAFKILQMNEEWVEVFRGLDRGRREFLLWRSDGLKRILTAPADDATYWLATTRPEERMLRNRLKDECGGDYIQAVERCIEASRGEKR